MIRFSSPDGFETGDAVHYLPESGSTSISGLSTTTTYYVRTIDADTIKLYTNRADAIAAPVTFTSSAVSGSNHTLTLPSGVQDGEVVSYQAPTPLAIGPSDLNVQPQFDAKGNVTGLTQDPAGSPSNDIFVGPNTYQSGDAVIYHTNDTSNAIGGLTDGTPYFVIADSTKPDTIQLAASFADATAKTPKAIPLTAGTSTVANADYYLVRPAITGLTSGATYTLKLVDAKANTYNLLDAKGNVVNIDAVGMSGTHELFKDGIALTTASAPRSCISTSRPPPRRWAPTSCSAWAAFPCGRSAPRPARPDNRPRRPLPTAAAGESLPSPTPP